MYSYLPLRFIPAYAGNTELPVLQRQQQPVHPRVCGEHNSNSWGTGEFFGSSPRMRGTHVTGIKSLSPGRFIPAYAGNTCHIIVLCPLTPVHPRVCGEHASSNLLNYKPVFKELKSTNKIRRSTCLRQLEIVTTPEKHPSPLQA